MAQSAKKDLTLLHALITVFLMFGFAYVVPPLGSITPYEMCIRDRRSSLCSRSGT